MYVCVYLAIVYVWMPNQVSQNFRFECWQQYAAMYVFDSSLKLREVHMYAWVVGNKVHTVPLIVSKFTSAVNCI